jgi:hypothetical protein
LVLEFFETQSCDPKPVINYCDYENDNYTSDYDDDRDDDDDESYIDKENYSYDDDNNNDNNNELMNNLCISNQINCSSSSCSNNNCGNAGSGGGGDDDAGLWWDEDNALNELTFDTMSSSFNNYNSNIIDNSNLFTNTHDLDCLENILKNYSFNDNNNNNEDC